MWMPMEAYTRFRVIRTSGGFGPRAAAPWCINLANRTYDIEHRAQAGPGATKSIKLRAPGEHNI